MQGLVLPQQPQFGPFATGMTPYEQDLDPIFDKLMGEERDKRSWQRPVQWIFDRLQTGQYVSANLANEIIDAFDRDASTKPEFFKAVYEGVTGETKGSYENILRDRLDVGHKKIFGGAPEGTRRSQWDAADLIGFVADVLLDPLTYMGFGGAAKAAKNAASKFADDAVRITLKRLADEPAEIVAKAIGVTDPGKISRILAMTNTSAARKKLSALGDDLGKFMDLTYREAYRTGLHKTQSELVQQTTKGAQGLGMDELMGYVGTGAAYEGAGKRFAGRFLGKEFGVKEAGPAARSLTEGWDKFARWFGQENPTTSRFRGAVWGNFNRGPIGEMRRALGFRNPYQKYLRAQELEQGLELSRVASTDFLKESQLPLQGLSDDEVGQVLGLMAKREAFTPDAAARRIGLGAEDIAADPKIAQAADELKKTFDQWNAEEGFWAGRMGETAADYREWYVPEFFRETTGGTNVRRGRKYTFEQSAQRETDLMEAVWGIDTATAQRMVRENVSGFSTDLQLNAANRALVHGKAKARWNLTEQMRELGINLNDVKDPVAEALVRGGRKIEALGLQNVDHAAFEGYVFDADVAEIIDRAMDVTGPATNVFKRGMAKFANWWKSIVTMTTGFHGRNFISDTLTLYLHHGPRALSFDGKMMALAGVASTMRESSRKAFLGELGLTPQWMQKYLNRTVGNLKVSDLAEYGHRTGLITEATKAFDPQDIVEKLAPKKGGALLRGELAKPGQGLLWGKGKLRGASRSLGGYIESTNRFHSFLIDYADLAVDPKTVRGVGEALESAIRTADAPGLEWAGREAKRWFIDYSNLSNFEQTTMKSIVPFYSWIRHNLANQIAGVALYPDLYSILPKIEELMSYEDPDYDPTLVPPWLREAGAFPVAETEEGLFRMFRPDFAHTQLNLIPLQWEEGKMFPHWKGEDLKDSLINSAAPWVRRMADMIIESDNPYHFFYKQELEPTAPAPYLMRLFASRPGVVPLVDGLLKKFGFENGAELEEDSGKLRIDSHMAILLEEFLPVLRQFEFAFYLPQTVFPGLERAIEDFSGAQDNYEGVEQAMQMLSFYLGIKTRDEDLEREKEKLGRDIYFQATEALTEERRERPGAQVRSSESAQRRNESIRRLRGY